MATPVIMPREGQSVETCIITEWYKKKGDKVNVGDPLYSYETDKTAFDQEAEVEGELLEIFFEQDEEVPVLTNIAVIGEPGESVEEFRPDTGRENGSAAAPAEKEPAKPDDTSQEPDVSPEKLSDSMPAEVPASPSAVTPAGELKVSPRARKIAAAKKVPLSDISGTGPEERIIERDVLAAAEKTRMTSTAMRQGQSRSGRIPAAGTGPAGRVRVADLTSAAGETIEPLSNIRKTIARRMLSSLRNTAQLTLHATADARRLRALRKKYKAGAAEGGPNVSINDMVCFAVVKTLPKHPRINTHFLDTEMKYFGNQVHLGVAVDTKRGLMVPTVHNAQELDISELGTRIRELAAACRGGGIDPGLLEGATFTVTNLGVYGIESFTPVLNPPQTGIIGVNTITYQPADLGDGNIGFIPRLGLSLTFDHRALDGAPAAAFLRNVCKEISALS